MSLPKIPVPPVSLQCAIAKGWSDDEIVRRLGVPQARVTAARVWLDELIAEDPPFVVNTPVCVDKPGDRKVSA